MVWRVFGVVAAVSFLLFCVLVGGAGYANAVRPWAVAIGGGDRPDEGIGYRVTFGSTVATLSKAPASERVRDDYRGSAGGTIYSDFTRNRVTGIFLPYWLLITATGILPGIWMAVWTWHRVRLRRRLALGCCVRCGYDLRASPERCPECGAGAARPSVGVPGSTRGRWPV